MAITDLLDKKADRAARFQIPLKTEEVSVKEAVKTNKPAVPLTEEAKKLLSRAERFGLEPKVETAKATGKNDKKSAAAVPIEAALGKERLDARKLRFQSDTVKSVDKLMAEVEAK